MSMPPLTLFGHVESWVRIDSIWIITLVLTLAVFGVIARVGRGKK